MSIDPGRLSTTAASVLADPANRRLLSAASVLELSVKTQLGKITLHAPLDQVVREGLRRGVIEELPVTIQHSLAVSGLPLHHRDPFDRLLIAQAEVERLPLVTNDAEIMRYGVPIVW